MSEDIQKKTSPKSVWLDHMRAVTVPEELAHLQRSDDGYLITYATKIQNGEPIFKSVDPEIRGRCWKDRICGICGRPLGEQIVMVTAMELVEARWATDVFMHEKCARYAIEVYPYIKLKEYVQIQELEPPKGLRWTDGDRPMTRPEVMVLYFTDDYSRAVQRDSHGFWVVANAPQKIEIIPATSVRDLKKRVEASEKGSSGPATGHGCSPPGPTV